MQNKQTVVTACILFLAAGIISAQVVTVSPEKPVQGETVTVGYDPGAVGAVLTAGEKVYCTYAFFHEDLSNSVANAPIERSGDIYQATIDIPEGAAFLTLYFLTLESYDSGATRGISLWRPNGRPARGAFRQRMTSPMISPQYMEYFEQEMQYFPDNVSAYIDKWLLDSFIRRNQLEQIISQDLKRISAGNRAAPDEQLAAEAVACIFLQDEEAARASLKKLLAEYPDSRAIPTAANKYLYHARVHTWQGTGPDEMKRLIWQWIGTAPASRYARVELSQVDPKDDVDGKIIEKIGTSWMTDEPENPLPCYLLATAWIRDGIRLQAAEELLEKALDLLLQKSWRLYEDISGKGTPTLITQTYLQLADLNFRKKSYAKASAWIQQAVTRTESASPEMYMLKGAVHKALDEREKARESYMLAWKAGSEAARDTLRQWYLDENGSVDGFDKTLGLKDQSENKAEEEKTGKKSAPDFTLDSLDGEELSLTALKGKVVVLNFWGTGCGPCKKEIPELNHLVEQYREREIVFIAVAPDFPEQIKAYLKKQDFLYVQVSGPKIYSGLAKTYQVRTQPTHIFIDRNGCYDCRLTGAKNIGEIAPIIERLLNE
ncbi:TlpA family protein disulfide reductase [bacterium]|nr:TlpA family protein disulfide reductase [bacterium]